MLSDLLCNAGEGLDDPNWELSFAETAGKKLGNWLKFVKENRGKGRKESHPVDDWFKAIMSDTAYKATKASDRLKFRTSTRLLFLNCHNITNGTYKELASLTGKSYTTTCQ